MASLYHKVPTDQPIKLGGLKSASNAHTLIPTTIHAPDPPDMSILSPGLMNNVAIDTVRLLFRNVDEWLNDSKQFNLGNATHNDHSLYPFLVCNSSPFLPHLLTFFTTRTESRQPMTFRRVPNSQFYMHLS